MPTPDELVKLLNAIEDPKGIKDALYASSPYVLRKAFDGDPGMRELLRAGPRLAPMIAQKLEAGEELDEISACAYFYLLEHIGSHDAVARALSTPMRARLHRPSPFLSQFSTRAILQTTRRVELRSPSEMYSPVEVLEAIERFR